MSDILNAHNVSSTDTEDTPNLEHPSALKETEYLHSIPNLVNSILELKELDDSAFSEEIEW